MTLRYTDIDPNVIELITRKLQTPLENLIEEKIQRRQQWGPTFKQEDIAELAMTDADLVVPAPEYGKRIFRFGGALTAPRVVRVPPIPSAWWIVHNRTSQPLTFLTDPAGTIGPTITADALGGIYTDGVGVWQFACCGEAVEGGEEMPPGGAGTNIQYRLSATTFGGVGGSSVNGASGQNVVWEGSHTMSKAGNQSQEIVLDPNGAQTLMVARQYSDANTPFTFVVQRARGSYITPAVLSDGDFVSYFSFRGQLAGGMTQLGYITTTFISDIDSLGDGGVLTLGARAASEARIEIGQGTHPVAGETAYVEMFAGAHYFQVQTNGLVLSAGEPGSIFFIGPDMAGTSYLLDLDIGAEGDVLKVVGGYPAWGAVAGASFPKLNQVVDPDAAKDFVMENHTVGFTFNAAESENCFVIRSIANAIGASNSAVLSVETPGASNLKMPFMVSARGFPFFNVYADGNVGVRTASNPGSHFHVAGNTRMVTGSTDPGGRTLDVSSVASVPRGTAAFTAQDGGTLSAIYANVDVSTNASFSGAGTEVRGLSSKIVYSGTLANPKLRGVTSFFDPIGASISSGGSYTAFYAPANLTGSPSLNGRYIGLYLAHPVNPWISGKYGVVTEPGLMNALGFDAGGTAGATLHVNGTVRFDLGGDTQGDIYYRAQTTGTLTRLQATSAGLVLTLQAVSGGLEPRWMTGGSGPGGGTPGDPVGGLQYNVAGTGFGGVTDSLVTGANIKLAGDLSFQRMNASTMIRVDRLGSDLVNGNDVVEFAFYGKSLGGAETSTGFLKSYWDTGVTGNKVIEISQSDTVAARVSSASAGIYAGAHFMQVQSGGIRISGGLQGTLWYQEGAGASSIYWPLDISTNANHVLRTDGARPYWGASPVSGTPGTGTPGGSNLQIQYNQASSFGGSESLSFSPVDGVPNLVLAGGYFQLAAAVTGGVLDRDQEFFISAKKSFDATLGITLPARFTMRTYRGDNVPAYLEFYRGRGTASLPSSMGSGDTAGTIRFRGFVNGTANVQLGYIDSFWESTGGAAGAGTLRLAAKTGLQAYIDIRDNNPAIGASSVTLNAAGGTHFVQVQQGGVRISVGTGVQGTMLYQGSGSTGLVAITPSTNTSHVLCTQASGIPIWGPVPGGPGGGIPSTGGSVNAIQYSTGTTSLGGINTALGVLIATGSGIVAGFGTNFPASRFTFSATTTAGLNIGTASSDPTAGNSVNGDVYYNNSTGKFRGRQNSVWVDLVTTGGTVTPPVTFTYTNTSTADLPTLTVNHTLQTSGTLDNSYGTKFYFHHQHTGGLTNASTSQRVGFTFVWNQIVGSPSSTKGDSVLQLYVQNAVSIDATTTRLSAIMVEPAFASSVGVFTGLRLKGGGNVLTRRAIVVENGAGDVVINEGASLTTGATSGFLYIPCMDGPPGAALHSLGLIPAGTVALVFDRSGDRLYICDNAGWKSVAVT